MEFKVLARDIHPTDQIEFHKQVGEMIYSTLTGKFVATHQLQISLYNISAQYHIIGQRYQNQVFGRLGN